MRSTVIGQAAILLGVAAKGGFGLPKDAPRGFSPESLMVARAAVGAMQDSDVGWLNPNSPFAAPVLQYFATLKSSSAFMAALARELIIRAPFRKAIAAATADATAWVLGQGAPVPLSRFTLSRRLLTESTIVAMLVAANELLDTTGGDGSLFLDNMLQQAAGQMADQLFRDLVIDSSISSIVSAGATAINAAADIKAALVAVFSGGQLATRGFWVFSVDAALAAATLTDAEGLPCMPEMGINGGMIAGLPAFVSSAWPAKTVTLFDGGQLVANTDQLGISASKATAVEMSDGPLNNAASGLGAQMVSMWSSGAVAIKQNLRMGVERVRDTAAAEIVDVSW